jgi:hypothetical protein
VLQLSPWLSFAGARAVHADKMIRCLPFPWSSSLVSFFRAGENSYILSQEGEAHYMRGGKPGYFPTFAQLPHPVPFNLFDPFGLSKNASPEKKAKGLLAEINNGRLAQIGIFGFLAESQTPGSVPGLQGIANLKTYSGNIMIPFEGNFHVF